MKIKKLEIDGFRSLVQFSITFDDALTLIVGENDAGKTSLIECLKVITQGRTVGPDDLTYGRDQLTIVVEIDDFIFKRTYQRENGVVTQTSFNAFPTQDFLERTLEKLNNDQFNLSIEENQVYVKQVARTFGLTVRANSILDNLRKSVIEKIENNNEDLVIENAVFPHFNSIQLDGRQFENIPAFFKEVFLKEKQANIWLEPVAENTTIESFVRAHLEKYSDDVTSQIKERGILDKLKIYLHDLTDIRVEPVFQTRDLNVDAKVKFLENNTEINIDNKGDGTKRRITMALLEFKKEQSLVPNDDQTIYLLDEPDTHLHVKAQLELIETIQGFASAKNQVIFTTHSPFIVNAVKPSQIRLLSRDDGVTNIKFIRDAALTDPGRLLRSLGIENMHLFFSRQLIIVEGETEEHFLPIYYLKQNQRTMSSRLVKIINVKGVHNIVGFARAILELHDNTKIYILCDNDISGELAELIAQIRVPDDHKFYVGTREFEDAFQSDVLHRCWSRYYEECERLAPADWTPEAIEQLKETCIASNKKFSKALKELNQGGKAMTKPMLGKALGDYAEPDEIPQPIHNLFTKLENT
jgi:putative ATP-dependent endonuclease of OLD family